MECCEVGVRWRRLELAEHHVEAAVAGQAEDPATLDPINTDIGEAVNDRKKVDNAAGDLAMIAGQRPVIWRENTSLNPKSLAIHVSVGPSDDRHIDRNG